MQSRTGSKKSSSESAAFGAQNGSSGPSTASTRPQLATPLDSLPIRLIRKFAAARPATTKLCAWFSIPSKVSFDSFLRTFWENHDPTQGFRQGNDVGTQYRSGIYCVNDDQKRAAERSKSLFGERLQQAGYDEITTEILALGEYYFAEDYHQQYLANNPNGYCGLGGTGVSCPIGLEKF